MVYFVSDREMLNHFCPWPINHIEVPQRLAVVLDTLKEEGQMDRMTHLPARLATEDEISIVHTRRFIDEIKSTAQMSVDELEELCKRHEDVYMNEHTWRLAQMAAGCSIDLVKNVLSNKKSGFAAVRPPGHHAFPDAACGFCVFNNVAIAAKHALREGAKRVLIVDWDIHAGQGTQECIEGDNDIRLVSVHRYEEGTFWPNLAQSAVANQYRNTVNVPLNGLGFDDSDYLAIMELVVLPVVDDFRPDIIIVSCGFDAAFGDPEGRMKLLPGGFAAMTRLLQDTGIPLALIFEGGYFLESVRLDALFVVRTLLADPIPLVPRHKMRDDLVRVIRRVYACYADQFPTYGRLAKIIGKVAKGHFVQEELEYKGERTVCEPYDTRGDYPVQCELVKREFGKQLNLAVLSYQFPAADAKPLPVAIVTDRKNGVEPLEVEDGAILVREDAYEMLRYLLLVPMNQSEVRRRIERKELDAVGDDELDDLAACLERLRENPAAENAPIFSF